MIDIFVNYRTADGAMAAALLDAKLVARFGREHVFRDTRTLETGRAFPEPLLTAVNECRVLVAVIGPRWLEPDVQGHRRIDDPGDYVHREIATALHRNIIVLPVRVEGAQPLTEADALPAGIESIAYRQGLEIRPRHEEDDAEVLLREIARYVPQREGPPSVPSPRPPQKVISTGNITGSNVSLGPNSPVIHIGNVESDEGHS